MSCSPPRAETAPGPDWADNRRTLFRTAAVTLPFKNTALGLAGQIKRLRRLHFLVLAGPHPRSLSLGGAASRRFPPAPRSGRRRFSSSQSARVKQLRVTSSQPAFAQVSHERCLAEAAGVAKADRQSPVASRQSPVASRQSPVASRQSLVASRQSPVASRQSPVASRQSPVASRQSPVASRQSPVASR